MPSSSVSVVGDKWWEDIIRVFAGQRTRRACFGIKVRVENIVGVFDLGRSVASPAATRPWILPAVSVI
jgi:hypothetical protein